MDASPRVHAPSPTGGRSAHPLDTAGGRSPTDASLRPGVVWRWALAGSLLGVGAPLGWWLLVTLVDPPADELLAWMYAYTGIATSVVFGGFGFFAGTLMKRLNATAIRDGLTELHNRRHVLEAMPRLWASAQRRRAPLCLLMLDLDHFKRVNDAYGHVVGDRTLVAFAGLLREQTRAADLAARWGGEEFLVLCPDTDAVAGLAIAERIRAATAALDERALGHPLGQTVSVGVAAWAPADGPCDLDELLGLADAALYSAKASGRDRAHLAQDPSGSTRAEAERVRSASPSGPK